MQEVKNDMVLARIQEPLMQSLLYVKLLKKQKNARLMYTYITILLILSQPLTQYEEEIFGK